MVKKPTILILHTVGVRRWDNGDELYASIDDRFDGLNVQRSRNMADTQELIGDAEIVVASRFPSELLAQAQDLRWIQALSSGMDFYDLEILEENGIIVTNVSGVHSEPIAEQVVAYMLAFERRLLKGIRQQENALWRRYDAGELSEKTIGIVGVGAVGGRVAEICGVLGMNVLGVNRSQDLIPYVDEMFTPCERFDLIDGADYLLLSCPLTDETEGLIGPEELKAMKSSAVLINISRGPVIDEPALVETLQQAGIRGAALDVFRDEPLPPDSLLWDIPNVIVTPHIAGSSPQRLERVIDIFAHNYQAYTDGELDAMVNRVL